MAGRLVLSGEDIPVVASPDQAQASPEAALLSLAVHSGGPRGVEVAAAIVPVAQHWGTEYKIIIETLLTQLFDTAKREALEARTGMDLTEWFRNHENENIRQSFQRGELRGEIKGEIKGEMNAVLKVLEARGMRLAPVQEQQIRGCQDTALLERWLLRALTASSVDEVLADPA